MARMAGGTPGLNAAKRAPGWLCALQSRDPRLPPFRPRKTQRAQPPGVSSQTTRISLISWVMTFSVGAGHARETHRGHGPLLQVPTNRQTRLPPVCCATAQRRRPGTPSCATEAPTRAPKTPQKRDQATRLHSYGSPPSAWVMTTQKPMDARAITWPSPAKARTVSAWPIRQEHVAGFDDLGLFSARNLQKLSQQLPNLRQRIPYGHRRPLAYSGRDG